MTKARSSKIRVDIKYLLVEVLRPVYGQAPSCSIYCTFLCIPTFQRARTDKESKYSLAQHVHCPFHHLLPSYVTNHALGRKGSMERLRHKQCTHATLARAILPCRTQRYTNHGAVFPIFHIQPIHTCLVSMF
jgi:hypothetical protein